MDRSEALQRSYDRVTPEYAARFFDELAHKPLDRALLDSFAEQVPRSGPVADVGCGPGQIGRYLWGRGLGVVGVDLSPAMVAQAAQLTPEIPFRQGNMLALDVPDGAWAGIVAFYSAIHLAPAELPRGLGEFYRVLQPGGLLLLSFHIGTEPVHLDEWWGYAVDLDFYFYDRATVEAALAGAGFTLAAYVERPPYAPLEHPTRRMYLLARKPLNSPRRNEGREDY
jgi:SAM-dependent methyltransferase